MSFEGIGQDLCLNWRAFLEAQRVDATHERVIEI